MTPGPLAVSVLIATMAVAGASGCTKQGGAYRSSWQLQLGFAGKQRPGPRSAAPATVATAATAASPAASGACQPAAGGPYWIEEEAALVVDVRCASGATGIVLAVDPLPAGATLDAGSGQLRWTPGLDQAGVYRLRLSSPSTGEEGWVQIGVADRFDSPHNQPIASPESYPAEMGVPVMHLKVPDNIGNAAYAPATVVYRGRVYAAEAKLRGKSSFDYPKKNYTLRFKKTERFDEPDLGGGFTGKRRLVLITTFDDSSLLRWRLGFELWNRLSPNVKIKHFSAVVYVNGRFNGVYTVAEHVDEELLAAHGYSRKTNLYKVLDHSGNFYSADVSPASVEKKDGEPEDGQSGSHDDLKGLLSFVVGADAAAFAREAPAHFDLPDYRAWLFAVMSMMASDSYGKNAYHYRDPVGGPFHVLPWDYNASFGQAWETSRDPPSYPLADQVGANGMFKRLFEDATLGPETRASWRAFVTGPASAEVLIQVLDAMAAEIAPAAKRDNRRWWVEHLAFPRWSARTDFADFDGELDYIRAWIRARWQVMAGSL